MSGCRTTASLLTDGNIKFGYVGNLHPQHSCSTSTATTVISSLELLQAAAHASKSIKKQLGQYAVEVGTSFSAYLLTFWQDDSNKDVLMLIEDLRRVGQF
jgi:hypothetical protein